MTIQDLKKKQTLDFMEIYNNGCDYSDLEAFISKVRKETAEFVLEAMTGERRIAFHEGEYNERIAEEKETAVEILKDIN